MTHAITGQHKYTSIFFYFQQHLIRNLTFII